MMIEETGVVGVHFPGYLRYAVCGDIDADGVRYKRGLCQGAGEL